MPLGRWEIRKRTREDFAEARAKRRPERAAERARRDARMIAKLKKSGKEVLPAVQSWLSQRLGKPFRKITQEEMKALAR